MFPRLGQCWAAQAFLIVVLLSIPTLAQPSKQGTSTAILERALAFEKAGDIPAAIASLQDGLHANPHNLPLEIALAEAYRRVPNFDEAKRILEAAAHQHPSSSEPPAALGDLEIQLQTYDVAVHHLENAVRLEPSNVDHRNLLAAAYKAAGDADKAQTELKRVLSKDPHNALALYLEAEIHADANQNAMALAEVRQVVKLQPNNPRGRLLLGKILLRPHEAESPEDTAKRCTEAADALAPVAQAKKDDQDKLFLYSRALKCAGKADEAAKALADFETVSQSIRDAKQNELQSKHLVQQANDAALKNDAKAALELAQQALEKDPKNGAAYSLMAKIYYSSGHIDQATEAIGKAIALSPMQPDFHYVRGKILEKQGKLDEALAAFAQTTLLNPKESDAYFEVGAIYQQRHDVQRARAAFQKAVELSPDDPDYRRALASLKATQ